MKRLFTRRLRHQMIRACLLLLAPICLLSGCVSEQRTPVTKQAACSFHLATNFRNEPVAIYADSIRVFSGKITTDDSTGVAKYLSIPTHGPRLQLRIETSASGVVLAEIVDLRRGRYVAVDRDWRTRKLKLVQQATPFLFD